MLECDFCGCSSPKPGKGWVAHPRGANAGNDESGILVYCPPCAAAVFNYPLAAAAEHVCVWKPQADSGPRLALDDGEGA